LGHAHVSAWHQGLIRTFKLPTPEEAKSFGRTLGAWNAASHLDPATFHDRFTRGLVDTHTTVARLRQAAAGSAKAQTIGQMVDASRPLTAAIRDIGASRWDGVRERLAEKAAPFAPPEKPAGGGKGNREVRAAIYLQRPSVFILASASNNSDNHNPSPPAAGADAAKPNPSQPVNPNNFIKPQADELNSYLTSAPGATFTRNSDDHSKPDPFALFAFPIMFYCEGSFVADPIAGIKDSTYQELLHSRSVRPEYLVKIKENPIPNLKTVANFYRAYVDDAMRKVVKTKGYDLLAHVGNDDEKTKGIPNFSTRLAFIDALFAPGPTAGPQIIRQAIRDTWERFHIAPTDLRDDGVIRDYEYAAFRDIANDSTTNEYLTERLRVLLDQDKRFNGRIKNADYYIKHRPEADQ
jgi:hypothetical protein